ncbi:unnamed protein product [Caenorhabditis nigoni]
MSSFSEFFSQTSTAYKLASTVISIGFVYNFFCCFLRYSIIRQTEPCDLHLLMSDTEFYFVLGVTNANHDSKIISFFDGMIQLLQLILFTYSTVSLARFIRESSRNKVMRSRESRETERTEGLILFTLVPFFVHVLTMSVRILTMLQTINASSHCIVCIFMSSQYRSAAKIEFRSSRVGSYNDTG